MLDVGFLLILLHLVGACIWVGGHLLLAVRILPAALRERDPGRVTAFEGAYEGIGMPALVLQVVTGLWLAVRLQPEWIRWFDWGDPLARVILVKLLCLLATIALAVHARLWLFPRLDAGTLPVLGWHIRGVTLLSLLFVLAGASVRVGGLAL
jgi:putative copper export protein